MSFRKKLILLLIVAVITIGLIIGSIIILANHNKKLNYISELQNSEKFKDTTPPTIVLDDTYIIETGYEKNLTDVIMSADDIDQNPKREILGDYDVNVAGEYNLTYKVTDNSGNFSTKDFTLKVKNDYVYKDNSKINFKDIIEKHKTGNTKIGIDVSKWQEDINWEKVKTSGAEFAVLRMGYQNGFDGEVLVDPYFEQNANGCIENRNTLFNLFFFICQICRRI